MEDHLERMKREITKVSMAQYPCMARSLTSSTHHTQVRREIVSGNAAVVAERPSFGFVTHSDQPLYAYIPT